MLYDIDQREHCRNTIALSLHEGWHQYVQTSLKSELPEWLDEGLATVMEGYRLLPDGLEIDHDANRQRKRRAWWLLRRDRMQPLAEFITDDPHAAMARGRNELLNYYAQAWAYMRYMLADSERTEVLRRLLKQAAEGRRVTVVTPTPSEDAAFESSSVLNRTTIPPPATSAQRGSFGVFMCTAKYFSSGERMRNPVRSYVLH